MGQRHLGDHGIAAEFDRLNKPVLASQEYEKLLHGARPDKRTYINLAFLYFQAQDGGYAAHHHLTVDFLTTAWRRMYELLDEAERLYGADEEIDFVRKFFQFILVDAAMPVVPKKEDSAPLFVMYRFAFMGDQSMRQAAEATLAGINPPSDPLDRYIASVLKGAFHRRPPSGSKAQ